MRPHRFTFLLRALSLTALALAACGGGRPPVVATAPMDPPPPAEAEGTALTPEPVDLGPDFRPLEGEGLSEDYLAAEGEGGPLRDINFGYDRATLTPEAQAILEQHALWLQTHRDVRVRVEGHCDERGTVEYNLALGDQRAQVAREYLVGLGVSPERLTAVSYGKERPLDPGSSEAAWTRNRRAHFVVSR
jgi:peptidoglycan-associated lipoprotein